MEDIAYFTLDKKYTTGSSIMPQKKNPDIFELIRAKYSIILGEEFKIKSLISNLSSGYHRDFQLTKEPLLISFKIVEECLIAFIEAFKGLEINFDAVSKGMTNDLYAVEQVNKLVLDGIPFRDAYKIVGEEYR